MNKIIYSYCYQRIKRESWGQRDGTDGTVVLVLAFGVLNSFTIYGSSSPPEVIPEYRDRSIQSLPEASPPPKKERDTNQ